MQYLSIRYTDRLAEAGIERSVGSVGDAYDNALTETVNGLYKTEVIRHRGPWRTIDDVQFATLECVEWYNHRRLLEPIGYVPPAEFESMYYRSLNRLGGWTHPIESPDNPGRLTGRDTLMLRRFGNGQIEVSVRPPLVYLDHWALREISSSLSRQEHFVETFQSRGTLMVSLINMVEMAKQGPGPSHEGICRLLDRVGPNWVLTEFEPAVVGERETRGIHPPEAFLAPPDVFQLVYGQLPPGTLMLGAALAQFHDDEARERAKVMLAQPDMVARLRQLRARHRRGDVMVPNPNPERSVRWIHLELLRYLIKDGKNIEANDVADAWHAAVPLRYAHVILLDGAWVSFASKLKLPDTELFSKPDLDAALDAIRKVDTSRFRVLRPVTPRVLRPPSR